MSIGERIRIKRKELKLTLKNVHELTGISIGNLSDIERGSYIPSSRNLAKIAEALHCSADWILNGDTEISNSENGLTYKEKETILSLYSQLNISDKEEIIDIIKLKLGKYPPKKETSSHSDTNKSKFMA